MSAVTEPGSNSPTPHANSGTSHLHSSEPLSAVVARVDLVALVTKYAGEGRRTSTGWSFSCPNPEHPDRHPSFTVYRSKNGRERWKCQSQCAKGGDAMDLLEWLEGLSRSESARRVREMADPTFRARGSSPARPRGSVSRVLSEGERTELLERYLHSRKWPTWTVREFGLEAVLDQYGRPRVRHPFLRPERDGSLTVAYWQDRASVRGLSEEERAKVPKWLSSPGRRATLHNLPSLTSSPTAVLLTEGPADAISATVALRSVPDRPEGLAVLGVPGASAWRSEWSRAFEGVPVALWADDDEAGTALAERISETLGSSLEVIRSPEGGDLSDRLKRYGPESVAEPVLEVLDLSGPQLADPVELLLEAFPGATVTYLERGSR